jgi:FAD/FMN-containing dehydrogenase
MDALPATAIEAVLEVAARIPSPFTEVLLQPLGGAYERAEPGATALSHRDAPWMYHALAQWTDPADTPRNGDWTDELVAALRPYSRRATHPNHVSSDRQERVRSFYGAETYARLVAVKDRWDPGNVFCHNQNIRPSALSQAA